MGFGVGVYYSNNQKNIDILEIQKKNYKEVKELELKIQEVQLENRELQLKLTGYEKEKK